MIVDRIEALIRGDIKPTQAQLQLAAKMSFERGQREWPMFDDFFLHGGRDDPSRPPISASSPWFCDRRLGLALRKQPKEPPAPRALLAWYLGRCVESMVQRQIVLTHENVLWPKLIDNQLVEKECTLDLDGYEVKGHVDVVLGIDDPLNGMVAIPVEIKSAATYGWKKTKSTRAVDPMFGHDAQLQFYINALDAPFGIYVSVAKETGHACEVHVERDESYVHRFAESMSHVHAMHALDGLPEHPAFCTKRATTHHGQPVHVLSSVRCTYCPYTTACTGHVRATDPKGKPIWIKEREASA
jgi:CRISPR/Cas system-associated exonuclease Cas4 (RecB family)